MNSIEIVRFENVKQGQKFLWGNNSYVRQHGTNYSHWKGVEYNAVGEDGYGYEFEADDEVVVVGNVNE